MKKTLKGYLLGFLTASIFISGGVYAAQTVRIVLNGNELVPTDANGKRVDPILVDGTTYLPVRAISSALGLEVDWDEETYTVSLVKPEEEPTTEEESTVEEKAEETAQQENVVEGIGRIIAISNEENYSKIEDGKTKKLYNIEGVFLLGDWGNYRIVDGELEYFNRIDHYGWTRAKIEKTGVSGASFDPKFQIKFTDGTVLSLWQRKVKINTQWFNTSESLEANSLMTNYRSISNILGTKEIWYQTNEDGEITRIETIN